MAIDLFAWAASSPTLLVQLADDDLGVYSHYKGDEYKRITHPTHRLPRRHASQSYILVVRPDLQFCHIYTLIFLKAPKGLDHVPLECGNPHLEQLRLGRATTSNSSALLCPKLRRNLSYSGHPLRIWGAWILGGALLIPYDICISRTSLFFFSDIHQAVFSNV